MKNKIDKAKIQKAIKDILEAIGENPEREGLIETPKRVAEIMQKACDTQDVAVVIEAEHSCMTARGIKKPGVKTKTLTLRGKFKEDLDTKNELLSMI